MKARIKQDVPAKVLVWDLTEQTMEKLEPLCREEGLEIQAVPCDQLGETVGFLAGCQGFGAEGKPWEGEIPPRQAMVFCGMEEKRLRAFLTRMINRQVQVELKAILTPHNQKWTFGALLGELEKERAAMERR